jgi:predicted PurR-regulated permease PerM
MVLVVIGAVWLLDRISSIAEPLIVAAVIAAVCGVAVDYLERHRWPRPAGAAVLMLALIAVAVLLAGLVLGGISSQASDIDALTSRAVDRVAGWAADLGITSSADAANDVKSAIPEIGRTLLTGVAHGIAGLTSLVVFVGFTAFATFFLLKDGPAIGRWIERHMGMKPAEARIVMSDVAHALRQYFLGMTIVGAFNAAVLFVAALVVGVPLPGTVALVTFIGGYVPILGAWVAGIFVFALALADGGPTAAVVMALVVLIANGPLQQLLQPIAYGITLQLNALVVFSVTIAAGTLFGMVGLILGAPLVSAAVRIHADLARLKPPPDSRSSSATPVAAMVES